MQTSKIWRKDVENLRNWSNLENKKTVQRNWLLKMYLNLTHKMMNLNKNTWKLIEISKKRKNFTMSEWFVFLMKSLNLNWDSVRRKMTSEWSFWRSKNLNEHFKETTFKKSQEVWTDHDQSVDLALDQTEASLQQSVRNQRSWNLTRRVFQVMECLIIQKFKNEIT